MNKFLRLDPGIDTLLFPLENKNLQICCTDFPSHKLHCSFTARHVLFSSSQPEHIDTTITSSLAGFVKFALTKQNTDLQIYGDLSLAQQAQQILLRLDIDWEEELSKYTGDIIAHEAAHHLKNLKSYQRNSVGSLQDMITEFLQEESGLLPTTHEVNEFIHAVDVLRLRVDRLDARIKLYEDN